MKYLYVFFLMLASLSFLGCANPYLLKNKKEDMIHMLLGNEIKLSVRQFKTIKEKEKGLMGINFLEKKSGALFVYQRPEEVVFWMKNTRIPLDLIFFDKNRRLSKLVLAVQPCMKDPCHKYYAKNIQYVLEVNAGFVKENNIVLGMNFSLFD